MDVRTQRQQSSAPGLVASCPGGAGHGSAAPTSDIELHVCVAGSGNCLGGPSLLNIARGGNLEGDFEYEPCTTGTLFVGIGSTAEAPRKGALRRTDNGDSC